jgi:hypothetical protein
MWAQLTPEQQGYYHQEAASCRATRPQELEDQRCHEAAALALLRHRLAEESARHQGLFRVGDFKLEDDDWDFMADLLQGNHFAGKTLALLREQALKVPLPPPLDVKQALMACAVLDPLPVTQPFARSQVPEWLRDLAAARHNIGTCLLFQSPFEQGDLGFLFLYATASPMQAYFLQVERQALPIPSVSEWGETQALLDLALQWRPHRYVVGDSPRYVVSEDLPCDDDRDLFVLDDATWVGPNTVVSASWTPKLWSSFLAAHVPPAEARAPRAAAAAGPRRPPAAALEAAFEERPSFVFRRVHQRRSLGGTVQAIDGAEATSQI